MVPRLLLSVRNADEARAAIDGGCDILDVKEPSRGALGRADVGTMGAIRDVLRRLRADIPFSVALGECSDWIATAASIPLPAGIDFLKLGTAGLATVSDWQCLWRQGMERTRTTRAETSWGEASPQPSSAEPQWIIVAYADWQCAAAPAPREILAAARALGCSGILIDTFHKEQPGTLHWQSLSELRQLAKAAQSQGLTFSLAGKLRATDLPCLAEVGADILGFRSAACRAGVRAAAIDASAVQELRRAMHSATSRGEWAIPSTVSTAN